MKTEKIGFIGGGNMASCLITGLVQSGFPADHIWVSDISEKSLQNLKDKLKVNVINDNVTVAENVDIVVLAVKPQVLRAAAEEIAGVIQRKQSLVVSIAAGISQNSLKKWLGERTPVVRTMPNTPALVMSAVTALHANEFVSDAGKQLAENILRAVGITLWVESESEMDAVTAVSGSGPAYFFLLMEAMEIRFCLFSRISIIFGQSLSGSKSIQSRMWVSIRYFMPPEALHHLWRSHRRVENFLCL